MTHSTLRSTYSVMTVTEYPFDDEWPKVGVEIVHTGEHLNDAPRRLVNALDQLIQKKGIDWVIKTAEELN